MRSELIFGAMTHVSNRFLLTKLAAKATRKLHKPNTRIPDTTNEVLMCFIRSGPIPTAQLTPQLAAIPLYSAS